MKPGSRNIAPAYGNYFVGLGGMGSGWAGIGEKIDEKNKRGAMKQGWQLAAVLVPALTVASTGQNDEAVLKARIPFPFVVAGHTLPAGRYVLSTLGDETVRLANSHNQGAFVMTSTIDARVPANAGKLIFHRYEDTYFLAEVWRGGSSQGKRVFKSPAEEDMEREGLRREIAVLRIEN
jgi:hypothetical protein